MFKYGLKDCFRFSNQSFIEKFDQGEGCLERLRNDPVVYGNQKRKRMIKFFDKMKILINKIDYKKKSKICNKKSKTQKKF